MNIKLAGGTVPYHPDDDALGRVSIEFAAFDGEVGEGELPVLDPGAEINVAGGRAAQVNEGATRLTDGFILDQDRTRGPQPAAAARAHAYGLMDANALLDGFRVERSRGAETDVARVLAFAALDLPDADTTFVIDSGTVTMPAKKYSSDGGWTSELIPDLVEFTGKTLFLHDLADGSGRCLHYHALTAGHTSGLTISDVIADVDYTTTFFPGQPQRSRTSVDLRNDVKGRDQSGRVSTATDGTSITAHDADGLQHQALIDFEAVSQGDLDIKTAAFLASQKDELDTWTTFIGPLDDTALALIRVGDLIPVTSSVMGLTAATKRIAHMTLTVDRAQNGRTRPGWWLAQLELGAPIRRRRRGAAAKTPPPLQPFVCTPTDFEVLGGVPLACVIAAGDTSCVSANGVGVGTFLYGGATYEVQYIVHHTPDSGDFIAKLSTLPFLTGVDVANVFMGGSAQTGIPAGHPGTLPILDFATTTYTAPADDLYKAWLDGVGGVGLDSEASSISARIFYLSGPDPRFVDLGPCSNGEPSPGQTITSETIVSDGTTTALHTNYDLTPGTLHVQAGGDQLIPDVTDAAAGAFSIPAALPAGTLIHLEYVTATGTWLGTNNPSALTPTAEVVPFPLLGTGGLGAGTKALWDNGAWRVPAAEDVAYTPTLPDTATNVQDKLDALTASPAISSLPWYDLVLDGGMVGDGVTGGQAAAMTAAFLGGTASGTRSRDVYLPPGTYLFDDALQDTGAFNGQCLFPDVSFSDPQITIRVFGAARPPLAIHGPNPTPLSNPSGYSVIYSTLTGGSGTAAVVSGGNGPFTTYQNNIRIIWENIIMVVATNGGLSGLNLEATQAAYVVDNWFVDDGAWYSGTHAEPTHTNTYGYKLPSKRNSWYTIAEGNGVGGFYTGFLVGEMTFSRGGLGAAYCHFAFELPDVEHVSMLGQIGYVACPYGMNVTGLHPGNIVTFDVEHQVYPNVPHWAETVADIYDPSDLFLGTVRWWEMTGSGTTSHTFTVVGGSNIELRELGVMPAGGSLAISDEGSPLSTDATGLDFVGEGVTASGSGATKTITIPGFTPTTDGLICVDPGTNSIDTGSPPGVTVTTKWGLDSGGLPYYDTADATSGEEAALYYDPATGHYALIAYDF